jgi:hypothetical protein
MMSEAVQVALIAAVAPTIAVLAASVVGRRKLQEIHVLVNSRLAEVTGKLDALEALRDAEGEAAKRIVLDRAAKDLEAAQPSE